MTVPEKPEPEYYLLSKRDDTETKRLNAQHKLLLAMLDHGHILDPSIQKEGICKVADVATGTGIWMEETARKFAAEGVPGKREFHGFDISPDQFPKNPSSDLKFHLQDVRKPFPAEYRGTFDLVHTRLLVGALKVSEIKTVFSNIVDLLKPGGYLQWSEFTAKDIGSTPPKPQIDKICTQISVGLKILDMAPDLPEMIRQNCSEAGMTQVTKTVADSPREHLELAGEVRKWYCDVLRAILTPMYIRTGVTPEEEVAVRKSAEMVKAAEMVFDSTDVLPNFPFVRVTGRKSL